MKHRQASRRTSACARLKNKLIIVKHNRIKSRSDMSPSYTFGMRNNDKERQVNVRVVIDATDINLRSNHKLLFSSETHWIYIICVSCLQQAAKKILIFCPCLRWVEMFCNIDRMTLLWWVEKEQIWFSRWIVWAKLWDSPSICERKITLSISDNNLELFFPVPPCKLYQQIEETW